MIYSWKSSRTFGQNEWSRMNAVKASRVQELEARKRRWRSKTYREWTPIEGLRRSSRLPSSSQDGKHQVNNAGQWKHVPSQRPSLKVDTNFVSTEKSTTNCCLWNPATELNMLFQAFDMRNLPSRRANYSTTTTTKNRRRNQQGGIL